MSRVITAASESTKPARVAESETSDGVREAQNDGDEQGDDERRLQYERTRGEDISSGEGESTL